MNYRQSHGPNCTCSMCSSCNSMPGCLVPQCRVPCSRTCPFCKANYRLYCYYLQGYQNLLRSKNRQLCMMEYFTRQMHYLKNAIQNQLEKCDKLRCCEKTCCEPKCYPCEPNSYPCEPKCYPCEPKCDPCEQRYYPPPPSGIKFSSCCEDDCRNKATYCELLDQLNYIKRKLSSLENQKCGAQTCKQCCATPPCQFCAQYSPPCCAPTTTKCKPCASSHKQSCCCSPEKKNSLVFEISYETHEKKKKPQSQSQKCRCSSSNQKRSDHNIIIDESGCVPKIRICNCAETEEKISCVPFIHLPSFLK